MSQNIKIVATINGQETQVTGQVNQRMQGFEVKITSKGGGSCFKSNAIDAIDEIARSKGWSSWRFTR